MYLDDNAIAQCGVTVHLLDLSMDLLQIQRLDLLMNGLSKRRGKVTDTNTERIRKLSQIMCVAMQLRHVLLPQINYPCLYCHIHTMLYTIHVQ